MGPPLLAHATKLFRLYVTHCLADHLRARVEFELLSNVVAVYRHRLRTEVELPGDFFCCLSLPEKTEHLKFAIAESFQERMTLTLARPGKGVEHPRGELLTHIELPAEHTADSGEESRTVSVLHHVTLRASP